MFQPPDPDGRLFKVVFYNKEVRALVSRNRSHSRFGDRWAEEQTQTVPAKSKKQARSLIASRYPPEEGFVIQLVSELPNFA